MRRFVHLLAAGLVAAAVAASPARALQAKTTVRTADARKWEHDSSDLKPDPRYTFGALKNGLRYVWFKNDEPKKQVFLRLHVNVGSLVETDTEQGIAHFIEHMAFNGTKNFKAGTLVETFNKEGIKFGHDVNAHTGMDETVYELDLPDASPERLATALKWFRDVADGLKFEQKEVDSEKGVVDAEERDRGGEGFKRYVAFLGKILDGTLKPKRLPIGVKEVRAKFTPKICFGFYRKWYRPEHMTFVLGGDLGELDPTAEIEKAFGSIVVPKDPVPARPDPGRPTFANKAMAEKGGGPVVLQVLKLRPFEASADDTKSRTEYVTRTVAQMTLTRMLNGKSDPDEAPKKKKGDEAKAPERKFVAAADWFEMEDLIAGPVVQVIADKDNWRLGLMTAEREIRRAIEKGFDAKEMNEAYVKFNQAALVPRPLFPKPHTLEFVNQLLKACNERYVPMEDRASKEAYKPGAQALTVAGCQDWTKKAWSSGELVFVVRGDSGLGDDPLEDLKSVWDQAHATSLDKPLEDQIPGLFAAAKEPAKPDAPKDAPKDGAPAGKGDDSNVGADKKEPEKALEPWAYSVPTVKKAPDGSDVRRDNDLKAVALDFKNGVHAIYKHLDSRHGLGRFEIRFGEGVLPLDPAKADLAWVASQTFMECGLGKDDWKSVQKAMSEGAPPVDFSIEAGSCVFRGALFGDNLQRTFEVICAYLTDPGWRKEGFDAEKKGFADKLKRDESPSLGRFLGEFNRELVNGDRRFLPPDKAAVEAATLEDVKAFLAPQLDGPVSIAIVGSLEGYKIENALYSTFAALPQRRAARDFGARAAITPWKTGVAKKEFCDTGAASALVHMVFPTTDGIDVATRRRLQLLEDIVGDRLRIEIREKKSLAYSPRADSSWSEDWKGYGSVTLDIEVDEKKVDDAVKAIQETMVTLGTKGVTQAEVDRLRTAALGSSATWVDDSGFWFGVLRDALRRPAALDEVKNLPKWFDAATVPELNALCKQFFTKDRMSVFVAMPKK